MIRTQIVSLLIRLALQHFAFTRHIPAAIAAKLDVIVPQLAWELTGCEDCLELLRQDARRLAAPGA